MLPSQVREMLLAQHARIRAELDATRHTAAKVVAGQLDPGALLRQVGILLHVLNAHNAAEEAVLRPILDADALGPLRANRMFEEHIAEHRAFSVALSGSPAEIADGFADFADELLAHVEAEERTFLSVAVLRDPPAGDGVR